MTQDDCLVCRKHAAADPRITLLLGERVSIGHHPPGPGTYRGHLFVEPFRHIGGLGDLSDDEAAEMGLAITQAARALRAIGAEHVYSVVYGDGVPYLHVHLMPRWPGTPREFWGPSIVDWPAASRVDPTSLEPTMDALRRALAGGLRRPAL